MAKFKLDPDPDPEVTVIGISSHVPEHRLCWSLNKATGLRLTRRRTDIADEADGHTAHFATFDQADPDDDAPGSFTLIHNHSSHGVLLPEQKGADYFLVVDKERAAGRPDLLERVRAADFVLAAFVVDLRQLRAGHKLLA
ncbi:MAG: IPExxxVDY family protein [Flavobacteriales bacterium]|jgi:hypothetical protein|nr:IPExxxVDY family protein [Flavobacteriales bacterium]